VPLAKLLSCGRSAYLQLLTIESPPDSFPQSPPLTGATLISNVFPLQFRPPFLFILKLVDSNSPCSVL